MKEINGNEENRGLIDKKASKDQLVPFSNSVLELSHYYLSLSLTLDHLEFSWSTLDLDQGRKSKKRERKESKDQGRKSRIK